MYHRKCQHKGIGGQKKKANTCQRSLWTPSQLGQKFFVRFLGELKKPKSPFEINWPLSPLSLLIDEMCSLKPRVSGRKKKMSIRRVPFHRKSHVDLNPTRLIFLLFYLQTWNRKREVLRLLRKLRRRFCMVRIWNDQNLEWGDFRMRKVLNEENLEWGKNQYVEISIPTVFIFLFQYWLAYPKRCCRCIRIFGCCLISIQKSGSAPCLACVWTEKQIMVSYYFRI